MAGTDSLKGGKTAQKTGKYDMGPLASGSKPLHLFEKVLSSGLTCTDHYM